MKIIAVDDDDIALGLLNECLCQGGYEHVTLMSSPAMVLDKMMATAMPYECVLLDVEMPGKSGTQLCAEIRDLPRYRNTPIIMITKHADHAAVQQAFANGATDYMTKPFDFFEVLTRIRVAERLVQERQSALDSYVAMQQRAARTDASSPPLRASRRADTVPPLLESEIKSDGILSLSVFQNYLEQIARSDESSVNLMAIKIRRIDEIFAGTTPVEFTCFLKAVADALAQEFRPDTVFMTHSGGGTYLCAHSGTNAIDRAAMQQSVLVRLSLRDLPHICRQEIPPEIIIGDPLILTTTAKLNFRRAAKAATARMERRDDASHSMVASRMAG